MKFTPEMEAVAKKRRELGVRIWEMTKANLLDPRLRVLYDEHERLLVELLDMSPDAHVKKLVYKPKGAVNEAVAEG